jgi:radical SAM protein with 4Fe4S-binding SPASM domain
VKLTGGEPTLHPAFAEIVAALAAHRLPFTLFTNGRWDDSEALLRLLRRAGNCDGLLISLHGPDAATHEAFSAVAGSFGEATENLRRAAAAGVSTAASMVLQPANWERIEATLELALRLGAHHLVCNRWIGTEPAGMALPAAALRQAMATVERLRAAGAPIRFGNCIPQCFELSSSTGCTAGLTFFTVDAWGRVRPCNHAPESVGDLRTQSLAEIWNGTGLARWRAAIPAGCEGCGLAALCRGGCRAQALLAGQCGDPLMGAPVTVRPAEEPEVRLWSGWRPVGQFISREDGAALVLIRRGQVTAAPEALRAVVPLLDGAWTLAAIRERCGQPAVNWIGELYRQGWVSWG